MATESRGSSRSRHASKSSRGHSRSVTVRHRAKKPEDEAASAPRKPDVEELRRIRAAYFGRAHAERSKIIRPKTSIATSTTTRSRPASSVQRTYKRKKHTSTTSKSAKSTKSLASEVDRTAEYVYGAQSSEAASPAVTISAETESSSRGGIARKHRKHRSQHRTSSDASLPTVAETDITPDDSISVVAERQMSRESTVSERSRSSTKRSTGITSPSKLQSIAESATKSRDSASTVSVRKSTKRDSGLLKTLLRRNTTTVAPKPVRLVECLTCAADDVPHSQSAKLSCGHRMCHSCLQRVFEMSVKDPAHMPPRCCTDEHIPLKHVEGLFDLKFKMLWNRKYQEYHTKNRIYCPNSSCGDWIKPTHFHTYQGRKYAQCSRCKLKVCTLCNTKMHRSRECPKDPEIARLVEQAKEKGWQRCFNCSSMVELKEGCNHMTCRCLAEFCMICGAKWKTCDCPWFNYTNLPNPDALNGMRVPEPIQIMYRRVYNAAQPAAERDAAARPQHGQNRDVTYQQEMDQRRRQENLDADLARRLQLASLMDPVDDTPARHQGQMETWGLGNAAGHFMNEDFVNNAADVVMRAFGDANFGRRGERASGRRRRPRQPEQETGNSGLVADFLGDQSVLGIGPATRPGRAPA